MLLSVCGRWKNDEIKNYDGYGLFLFELTKSIKRLPLQIPEKLNTTLHFAGVVQGEVQASQGEPTHLCHSGIVSLPHQQEAPSNSEP